LENTVNPSLYSKIIELLYYLRDLNLIKHSSGAVNCNPFLPKKHDVKMPFIGYFKPFVLLILLVVGSFIIVAYLVTKKSETYRLFIAYISGQL